MLTNQSRARRFRRNLTKIGEIASYSKIEVWKMPYLRAFPDLANFVMGE